MSVFSDVLCVSNLKFVPKLRGQFLTDVAWGHNSFWQLQLFLHVHVSLVRVPVSAADTVGRRGVAHWALSRRLSD